MEADPGRGAEHGKVLPALPVKTDALMTRMEQGRLEVKVPELREKLGRLERSQRKLAGAVVFGVFLVAGMQLYLAHELSLAAVFARQHW